MMIGRKKQLIAVGYTIQYNDDLINLLTDLGIEEHKIPTESQVGMWFSSRARNITKECIKSDQELEYWYKKREDRVFPGSVRELYVSGNKRLVIAVVNCDGVPAYVFLYNEKNIPTSVIKKAIPHNLESHNLEKINFKDQLKVAMKPYIFYV